MILVLVAGYVITQTGSSNFMIDPPELNNYKDVLNGDVYREKNAVAAGRAR